jgi:hypothetical protein
MRFASILSALLVVFLASARGQQMAAEKEPDTTAEDQKTLQAVGVGVDGPSILDYYRKRTFTEADPTKVKELINDLGSKNFLVREKAHVELQKLGPAALVALKQAEKSPITETRRRAAELRHLVEAESQPEVQAASARLIVKLKPPKAAEVMLAYLPFADAGAVDDFGKALAAVAITEGKTEPALVKALSDKLPVKRALAAQALTKAKAADQLPAIRKMLKDTDALVRLRVGLALAQNKEKEAIPVLVNVMADLPPEQLWPAEELLLRLAGDKAPSVSLGTNETTRKACRDAWAGWLDANKDKIDLAKIDTTKAMLGYTLMVLQTFNVGRGQGMIMEMDNAKKPKWQFEVPTYPVDAVVTGPDRVLIAEFNGARITERDFKGNIKFEKQVNGNPIGVQRLPNGNTFVVTQNRLAEYNRKGEEVYAYNGGAIFRARKLNNGEIIFITNAGRLTRMEAKSHKVLASFDVGNPATLFGSIDVLPNGNILMPQYTANQVVEFDRTGKMVGTPLRINQPSSAVRLPNGHTLVGCLNNQTVAEFDRTGKQVWTHRTNGTVFNIRRR